MAPLFHALLVVAPLLVSVAAWTPVLAANEGAQANERILHGRVVDAVTSEPLRGAQIVVLDRPGEAFTDADGRFTWEPAPSPPFEVLVILPGDRYMKPVLVERVPAGEPVTIRVQPLVSESVTVTAGAAPDIESTPASGTTLLTGQEIHVRQPANLAQLLESVAGVSQVSEGQAAVPAIRGLARGRTLILIDGARVTTERRVGPSATYLDPFVLDSVEVSRGPSSVAYGSDAFGGIIDARTRRPVPGTPLRVRVLGALGGGVPEGRAAAELSRGTATGGLLVQAHYRHFGDYRSPAGPVFNSSSRDQGLLARATQVVGPGLASIGWQSDFGRDIERPRTNSRTVRFFYPTEDSHRFTASYDLRRVGGFDRVLLNGFVGSYAQVTDQDRVATVITPRSLERADVSARDFQFRTLADRPFGASRLEIGVDVNGRFGLRALDISKSFDTEGRETFTDTSLSVDNARRTDVGLFGSLDTPLPRGFVASVGVRGDRVTTTNRGGYFGDRTTSNGAASGFVALTSPTVHGFSMTGQVARGFRDPTLSDRYYRGPTGRGFITGNPDLSPETSLQFDGAIRYTAAGWRGAVYVYRYRIDDLVERFVSAPDFFDFRNRGRARIQGVELEAQADLGRGFTLAATGQITRGTRARRWCAAGRRAGAFGVAAASSAVHAARLGTGTPDDVRARRSAGAHRALDAGLRAAGRRLGVAGDSAAPAAGVREESAEPRVPDQSGPARRAGGRRIGAADLRRRFLTAVRAAGRRAPRLHRRPQAGAAPPAGR